MTFFVSLSIDRAGVEVDAGDEFSAWLQSHREIAIPAGKGSWQLPNGLGFRCIANEEGVCLETSERSLELIYLLVEEFFRFTSDTKAYAAIVAPDRKNAVRVAMISNDPAVTDELQDLGGDDLLVKFQARDVLTSMDAFAEHLSDTLWPDGLLLVSERGSSSTDAEQTTQTTIPSLDEQMILYEQLPSQDAHADIKSFLIFGVTTEWVMQTLLQARTFTKWDDEFSSLELRGLETRIEAAGFDTERGPATELRVPLESSRLQTAITVLAGRAVTLHTDVFYAAEILDEEGAFILRKIQADGSLTDPERIQMRFS